MQLNCSELALASTSLKVSGGEYILKIVLTEGILNSSPANSKSDSPSQINWKHLRIEQRSVELIWVEYLLANSLMGCLCPET